MLSLCLFLSASFPLLPTPILVSCSQLFIKLHSEKCETGTTGCSPNMGGLYVKVTDNLFSGFSTSARKKKTVFTSMLYVLHLIPSLSCDNVMSYFSQVGTTTCGFVCWKDWHALHSPGDSGLL